MSIAKVLFAWELGAGLGHVSRIQPIASRLVALGHHVFVVGRDLGLCDRFLRETGATVLQAPVSHEPRFRIRTPYTFTHVLFNCGFAEKDALAARVRAWRNLFSLIRPDLIVADYSPSALLAARGMPCNVVAIGTGFECPPDVSPLPNLRANVELIQQEVDEIESRVLASVNAVAREIAVAPLEHISQLYHDADDCMLLTYQELDPYMDRGGAEYYGAYSSVPGRSPSWPSCDGPRIFVYLKPDSSQSEVLQHVVRRGCPTIAYAGEYAESLSKQFDSRSICFENTPLAMDRVASEADLAITNGGHGVVTSFLSMGKPLMIVPQSLEQSLTSLRVEHLGAGIRVSGVELQRFGHRLDEMIATTKCADSALRFANKYNPVRGALPVQNIVQRFAHVISC